MTEIRRWLEDGPPPEIARLLGAAQREQPSGSALRRTLVAAAAIGAATTTTGGAFGIGAQVMLALKWGSVGVLCAGVVVGAVAGMKSEVGPNSRNARTGSTAAASVVKPRSESHEAAPVASTRAPEPTRRRASAQPSSAPLVDESRESLLAEEVALIDRARTALKLGDPGRAQQLLAEYDSHFREPHFAPEALYLKMEVRTRLGDRPGAEQAAQEILEKYPSGPQVGRAEQLLDAGADPKKE